MYDYQNLRLMHRHGDDWVPMSEARERGPEHHDSTEHDVERGLLRGGRVFRCVTCDEEIAVVDRGASGADNG